MTTSPYHALLLAILAPACRFPLAASVALAPDLATAATHRCAARTLRHVILPAARALLAGSLPR